MKKLICIILSFVILSLPTGAFAAEAVDLGEMLGNVSMELAPVTDSEDIEVGDQFLVSFKLTGGQRYMTYQIDGTFDAEKAQVVAPVYTSNMTVVQNDFDNSAGTFTLAAADLTRQGCAEEIMCSILFEAISAGEFSVDIDSEETETMVGRMSADENGGLFYLVKLMNASFKINEDSDGDVVYIIKEPDPVTPYDDMFGYDWAERSVSVLYRLGALENIADKSFFPAQNVTRGDFVTMMVRVCRLTGGGTEPFNDVSEDGYNYEPIMTAKSLNLVYGDENGNFRPDESISRQDICTIIFRTMRHMNKVKAMDDAEKYIGSFADKGDISDYAKNSVAGMIRAKIIRGDDNGLLRPKANMTRAEAAVVLNRVAEFNRLISL